MTLPAFEQQRVIIGLVSMGVMIGAIAAIALFAMYQRRAKSQQKRDHGLAVSMKDGLLDSATMIKKVAGRKKPRDSFSRSGSSSDSGTFAGSNLLTGSRHLASSGSAENGFSSSESDMISPSHLGLLEFTVSYEAAQQTLKVTVVRCMDLPPTDGYSDSYVKIQLLPEKRHRVKTNLVRKCNSPSFNETFEFKGINMNHVKAGLLHFVVLSIDRYSRDNVIGEIVCPVESLKLNLVKDANIVREILPRELNMDANGRGELLISLCHQPTANRLTVVMLKAKKLPRMKVTGLSSDPYVRINLYDASDHLMAKKKTHVKKRTSSPVYNETFTFDLAPGEDLGNLKLEFQVLDWDRVVKTETLGRVVLGLGGTSPSSQAHWREAMNCSRQQVAQWHCLDN